MMMLTTEMLFYGIQNDDSLVTCASGLPLVQLSNSESIYTKYMYIYICVYIYMWQCPLNCDAAMH